MKTTNRMTCPVCYDRFPKGELRQHVREETGEIRGYIFGLIKEAHPEWVEGRDSEQRAWEVYRSL